jgi:hypothetical protein
MGKRRIDISWEGNAWLHIAERATSFALTQKFPGLHFTISHVEGNEYVNFHLSKDKAPENNKAKIVIAKIKRPNLTN